jgi:Holliday junction DNA helicase RuvA
MYAYIKGIIQGVGTDHVILDNHGIGYLIFTPSSVTSCVKTGDEVRLYTHFSVREDAMTLYGFLSADDLALYEMLLKVGGIGPKGAIGILSVMDADDLRFAVLSGDAALIAKAPGIGKKTAQKVILELKDKLDLGEAFEKKSAHQADLKAAATSAQSDAVEALTALGYSGTEALRAVRHAADMQPDAEAEELIRLSLKELF